MVQLESSYVTASPDVELLVILVDLRKSRAGDEDSG
jgi:hypothetical protein